jgi:glycosyltransferase involved in cell wall biosynthesis
MKIAIIYPSLRAVGGAENVVIWLAESLAHKGHTVVLFTREYSAAIWENAKDRPYGVHQLDFKMHRSTLKTNREAGSSLGKALSSYHFDVINPHNYPASLWVYYAKQQAQDFPRIVLFLHNLTRNFYEKMIDVNYGKLPGFRNVWNRYRPKKLFRRLRQALFSYRRLDQEAVRACDKVLANSRYTADLASKIYNREVQTCTLGVPLNRSHRQRELAAPDTKTSDHPVTVLTVSRIELQKNFDTLLKALKILQNRSGRPARFKYKIVGTGPYIDLYQKMCRRMGLEGLVQFLGPVPHENIWKLYEEADFLVHVPLDEPFGLVPIEAALHKKPCIVSDHAGPAVTVINGITGMHVDALNPEKIAGMIATLLDQPELVKQMGEAAYDWVMQHMTWEMFVNNFEHHLNNPDQLDQA